MVTTTKWAERSSVRRQMPFFATTGHVTELSKDGLLSAAGGTYLTIPSTTKFDPIYDEANVTQEEYATLY